MSTSKYLQVKPLILFLIPIFCLLYSFGGFSQTYRIEGSILDGETRQPISGAAIILKNSSRGTTSGDQGNFKFEFTEFPAVLFIQCMGYVRDTVVIESLIRFTADFKNQNRVFPLKKNTVQINEVQVKARSVLFEKDPYAIVDFKIMGKRIVALGYKNGNEFRKEVLQADLSGKMNGSRIYRNLDSIYQDCQGNVFAFCKDSAYELRLTRKQISIANAYPQSFIADFIAPVCGITDSLVFIKKSPVNHQYDNYFAISDSQNVKVIYATGGFLKESVAASLKKSWKQQAQVPVAIKPLKRGEGGGDGAVEAKDESGQPANRLTVPTIKQNPAAEPKPNEKADGSMGPGWISYMRAYEGAYHSYFESQFRLLVDFPPVFTRMIPVGKNHVLFDREAATIFWFNESGVIIRETGMITRLNGIHFRDVHQDAATGRFYLEFPQGPFTHFIEINPETGQEVRRFMVRDFRHIEKCVFLNDRLYFLYQPDTGKRIKKVFSIWI